MDDKTHHEREHFFGAAKIMAALTLLSRLLGMVRDMAILAFGATGRTDAFWMAFSIPNLFRRLFGEGALSAAFVPVFTEVSEADGWDKARLVLANTFGVLAAILAGLLVVGELVLAGWLLWGGPGGDWPLLLKLTMIVLPFMVTVCLLALGSAALNCKGKFAYPAFAPILLNVALIAAAALAHATLGGDSWAGLAALSASVVVAGVVQLAGVLWLLRRTDLAAVWMLRPILPAVRKMARMTLPMMIPLGVLQFSAFFDRFWALLVSQEMTEWQVGPVTLTRPFDKGVVTCLYAGVRLFMFPLGILAISLATAVFPLLSRYARRGDTDGLRDTTNRALRLSLFLGIPAGLALILMARPVISLLFGRGDFSATQIDRTVPILQAYSVGLWAAFCNHILLRAFFAQQDTRTPMRITCMLVPLNMLLVMGGVFTPLGASAIGAASSLTTTLNVLILTWILRKRWGRIGFRRLLLAMGRIGMAAAAMGGMIVLCEQMVAPAVFGEARRHGWPLAARVVGEVVLAAGTFMAASVAMRGPELGELLGRARKTAIAQAESAGPPGPTDSSG